VGCDRFLDKFEPITETFAHYRIGTQDPGSLLTPIERITEDHAGRLWLATARGLYRLDPASGQTTRYVHDPADPTSIAGNRINFAAEDRTGRFWIANSGGLDEFDRKTGKVIRRAPLRSEVSQFHEDKFGVFWMTASTDSSCTLATLNLKTNLLTCHFHRLQIAWGDISNKRLRNTRIAGRHDVAEFVGRATQTRSGT
jgi:ligand-binding sensor domain-containing protein